MIYAVLALSFAVMHSHATEKLDAWVYFVGFWACAVAVVLVAA